MGKYIKAMIIQFIEMLDSSDIVFLRRIYISLEEYMKNKGDDWGE